MNIQLVLAVCLAEATTNVAVETNVGVTVSIANIA